MSDPDLEVTNYVDAKLLEIMSNPAQLRWDQDLLPVGLALLENSGYHVVCVTDYGIVQCGEDPAWKTVVHLSKDISIRDNHPCAYILAYFEEAARKAVVA